MIHSKFGKAEIRDMAQGLGWTDLGLQKNPWMISFQKPETDIRMNVYFTTMTVTIQSPDTSCKTYRDVDIETFEKILIDN